MLCFGFTRIPFNKLPTCKWEDEQSLVSVKTIAVALLGDCAAISRPLIAQSANVIIISRRCFNFLWKPLTVFIHFSCKYHQFQHLSAHFWSSTFWSTLWHLNSSKLLLLPLLLQSLNRLLWFHQWQPRFQIWTYVFRYCTPITDIQRSKVCLVVLETIVLKEEEGEEEEVLMKEWRLIMCFVKLPVSGFIDFAEITFKDHFRR